MNRSRRMNRYWKRIGIVLLAAVIVCAIAGPAFLYVHLKTQARMQLREAKNVGLYLRTLDIELYADGMNVYDGTRPDGLRSGVQDSVVKYLEHDCDLKLTSYNKKNREVTGFIYTYNNYQVIYRKDKQNAESWKVNYIFEILDYE